MSTRMTLPISARIRVIPVTNLLGNLIAVMLTYSYFTAIEPGLAYPGAKHEIWQGLRFFSLFLATIGLTVLPINIPVFLPLLWDFKRAFPRGQDGPNPKLTKEDLHSLAGRLMKFPVRLGVSNLCAWLLAGVILISLPLIRPGFIVWKVDTSHKMLFAFMFIGAVTAIFNFFLMEWWIRGILRKLFPLDALRTIPTSPRINVLVKLLVVSIMIGTVPVSVVSHITIHYLNNSELSEGVLSKLPVAIGFLLILSVCVGAGLSLLLAHSVSEPLRELREAIERIRSGQLDVGVRVVSNDEIGVVTEGFNRMVEERRKLDSIRDVFGQYLSEEVVAEILETPGGVDLRGELRDMTILVADLRGFTSLADSVEPQMVLRLINRFLERMTDVIIRHQGTIDEFTGDGILAFFGAPRWLHDHSRRAVACALQMQHALKELNVENKELGLPELKMGIGINSGELIVGNIGSEKRKKYGAVGSPINVAFRVEAVTRGEEVLITEDVVNKLDNNVIVGSLRTQHLKGISEPMALYKVEGLKEV